MPEEIQRRAYITEQFSQHQLDVVLFDAIKLGENNAPEIYQQKVRLRLYGRDLSRGEMGCYLSHRAIWAQFLATDERHCCILEDDVELAHNFKEVIEKLLEKQTNWDLVRLAGTFPRKGKTIEQINAGQYQLLEYLEQPRGTLGYVINREAAKALLQHTSKMIHAIDDTMDQIWGHKLRTYGLEPFVVKESAQFTSSIGCRKRPKMRFLPKMRKEFFKSKDALMKKIWQYKTLLRWKFIHR
ncbi:glycosyltransferase family 25 protein [Deefgea tanakiae]|uniref:Glycosyltransferase family 25 protein n=1 Tax=Deefgea tanakiae TaxID=2865840 RepID=A0ABX8Z5G7_9NEIS|nr:glycosyltransferase family 25 protein [Deefgea tanakiae]